MDEEPDIALWNKALDGDHRCFGVLFDRHSRRIYNHCFRRTANWSMAEDLTSVVFLEAWKKRNDVIFTNDSVLPWLIGVATNICRNALRSLRRYKTALQRIPSPIIDDHDYDDLTERLDSEQRMATVLKALRTLRQEDQEILTLAAWENMEYGEIAVALDLPIGTVRSRLSRARARLLEAEKQETRELLSLRAHVQNEHENVFGLTEES
jgi:RNA polymerase sigma factor (sigma-70 family)